MNRFASWGILVAATMAVAGMAAHARAAECGVGGIVTNKSNGILQQLLAHTTNLTFDITYTGAITTGTSGCSNSGIIKREVEQRLFVAANYDPLTADLARGQGERVAALSTLLGCPASLESEFGRVARGDFGRIVSGGSDAVPALLAALKEDLRVHPALSVSCTRLA